MARMLALKRLAGLAAGVALAVFFALPPVAPITPEVEAADAVHEVITIRILSGGRATLSWEAYAYTSPDVTRRQVWVYEGGSHCFGGGNQGSNFAYYDYRASDVSGSDGHPWNGRTVTLTGLSNSTTYYAYQRIRTNSSTSDSSCYSWTHADVPDAPSAPSLSGSAARTMTVSWSAPSNNNGSTVTNYQIRYKTEGGSYDYITDSASPATLSGLQPATTYAVSVRAYNSIGWGGWSSSASRATPASVPDAPTAPTVIALSVTSLRASFRAPDFDGGSELLSYDLQYRVEGGVWTQVLTQAGPTYDIVNLLEDQSVDVQVRANNAIGSSEWSDIATRRTQTELTVPGKVELMREANEVTVTWSAASGVFQGYTIQRQELVVSDDSSFFGNVRTVAEIANLNASATEFIDIHTLPAQTYEYRLATVADGGVGEYTDWFRIGPNSASLGAGPSNLRLLEGGAEIFDYRREFWMAWNALPGVDEYQVEVVTFDVSDGSRSTKDYIITAPQYFQTIYGRTAMRVRARHVDDTICTSAPEDRCLSDWTSWYQVNFTPKIVIDPPPDVDEEADADIMEFRTDLKEGLRSALGAAGADVNVELLLQFIVVVAGVVVGGMSIALSWRRGMAPLGVGMGAAALVLILYAGHRLLGTPWAWPVAFQSLIALAGIFALVRQTGVLR